MRHALDEFVRIRSVVLEDIDSGRYKPLALLPIDVVRPYLSTGHSRVEYTEDAVDQLRVIFTHVNQLPGLRKRYKVVNHHGSCWVSLPCGWLRNLLARPGDSVHVCTIKDASPPVIVLKFERKVRRGRL